MSMNSFLASWHERRGLEDYVAGKYASAERHFRLIEAGEPNSIRVLRNLGLILLARGDSEAAAAYLKKEEKLYGPDFQRHAALADLAYATGSRKEAARRYAAALECKEMQEGGKAAAIRPLIEARLEICASEEAFARRGRSVECFAKAQGTTGGTLPAGKKAARGTAATAASRAAAAEAFALYEEAIELDPTNWPAMNNAATLALNRLSMPEKANELFRRAYALSGAPQVARNILITEQILKNPFRKPQGRKS
jgi:Flp pilus assembly protein TadD